MWLPEDFLATFCRARYDEIRRGNTSGTVFLGVRQVERFVSNS